MLRSFGVVNSCSPWLVFTGSKLLVFTISRQVSQHQKHGIRWRKWAWHTKCRLLTYASWTTWCKDAACLMHNSLLHINRAHLTSYTIFQKLFSFVCVVGHLYCWKGLIFCQYTILEDCLSFRIAVALVRLCNVLGRYSFSWIWWTRVYDPKGMQQ